jgi:hypothetical protein
MASRGMTRLPSSEDPWLQKMLQLTALEIERGGLKRLPRCAYIFDQPHMIGRLYPKRRDVTSSGWRVTLHSSRGTRTCRLAYETRESWQARRVGVGREAEDEKDAQDCFEKPLDACADAVVAALDDSTPADAAVHEPLGRGWVLVEIVFADGELEHVATRRRVVETVTRRRTLPQRPASA